MRTNLSLPLTSLLATAGLLLAGCETPRSTPSASTPPASSAASNDRYSVPLEELDYSGDQTALLALDADFRAAGTDAAKLDALAKRLVALLRRADGSLAARQAACQRLGAVLAAQNPPDASALAVLKEMLAHPSEADLARLALEPAPGAAVDQVLLETLATTTGRTRIGIIQTLAKRRTPAAIPALTSLLAGQDEEAVRAATIALGQIGGRDALAALRASRRADGATIEAQLTVARQLPAAEGVPVFSEIAENSQLAAPQRSAALRGLIDAEPAAAAGRIAGALAGNDWTLKQAALEAILAAPSADIIPTLAARLANYDAPTQASLLAAFGRRPERSAVAATIAAAAHSDAAVRSAAIETLGQLPGDRDRVSVLARFATGPDAETAKLARQSLARLNGPDVSAAILAGAKTGDAAGRAVFVEQLALRNQTEALPFLRGCRSDADPAVRAAAIAALGEIAPAADQRLALEWAAAATDSTEQTRAIRAALNLTLRNPDTAQRALPVYQFIEQAEAPVAIRLLPLLQRLGGRASADAVARLGIRDNAALAAAATASLTRWPDATALPALATLATKATVASARAAAAPAALAYFEGHREPWTATESSVVAQLLGAATDPATRLRLVTLLNRADDAEALALAEKLRGDPALGAAATDAAQSIAANRAGAPRYRASDNERGLANIFDGKATTYWRTAATAGVWIEVDYLQSRPVHQLTIEHFGRTNEFPVRYEVYVTDQPGEPGAVRAAGPGQRGATVVNLPPGTRGRYVIIKYPAERKEAYWTISELYVN